MRTFIAIDFDEKIKQHFFECQQTIINYCSKGNFTLKENFHLTLKFIGEIKPEKVNELKTLIGKAASGIKPFKLKTSNPGFFKKGNRLILWMGLCPNRELDTFYKNIENALIASEYKIDMEKYSPHITLGREVELDCSFDKYKALLNDKMIEIPVDSITLMESTRINGKLSYVPIYRQNIEVLNL